MGQSTQSRVPAIVLAQGANALGVLRSLQLAGVPAYVACPPGDLVTRSRWYRPTPGAKPWDGMLGPHAWNILHEMPLEQAVLIPGADDAALWLADLPKHALAERFKVSTSSRETQELLQDKARFAAFLRETGIPHPPTFSIESAADIEASRSSGSTDSSSSRSIRKSSATCSGSRACASAVATNCSRCGCTCNRMASV